LNSPKCITIAPQLHRFSARLYTGQCAANWLQITPGFLGYPSDRLAGHTPRNQPDAVGIQTT
jgi:hypothetical protein